MNSSNVPLKNISGNCEERMGNIVTKEKLSKKDMNAIHRETGLTKEDIDVRNITFDKDDDGHDRIITRPLWRIAQAVNWTRPSSLPC